MSPRHLGEMPRPVQIPPTEGFNDVTNRYVPKSTSSMVVSPPSTRMHLPTVYALEVYCTVSAAM